jgi:hypothetical protein
LLATVIIAIIIAVSVTGAKVTNFFDGRSGKKQGRSMKEEAWKKEHGRKEQEGTGRSSKVCTYSTR